MIKLNPVQKITALCKHLPEKDRFYADAFLIRRDFVALRDLVHSDIIKVESNFTKENPKQDLLKVDVDKLRKLLATIDDYLLLLGETIEEGEDEDNLNEEFETYAESWN